MLLIRWLFWFETHDDNLQKNRKYRLNHPLFFFPLQTLLFGLRVNLLFVTIVPGHYRNSDIYLSLFLSLSHDPLSEKLFSIIENAGKRLIQSDGWLMVDMNAGLLMHLNTLNLLC